MVRLGIIGRNFVVDWMLAAAESVPALRPVAIYSRRLETGREFAQAHGLPLVFDRLEDLASCPEVDAVYIASPTGCHYDQARQMLLAGKHVLCEKPAVVTARQLRELLAIAREKNVSYLFEASVGGGIPVLRPLSQCLAGNRVQEIVGILNGTTNYILTRMVQDGVSFDEALKEAQAKGYAEQNPAADVEGLDACRKICILSDLAWGGEVRPEAVHTQGITAIDLRDVAIASGAGYRIKLLGRALALPDGRLAAYVAPHLVPLSCPVAGVDDVFNAIMIRGNAVGDVMFYGRGAGDLPTASAVMGDIIDALQHRGSPRKLGWDRDAALVDFDTELPLYWYLRGDFTPPPGSQILSDGAVIVGPVSHREAKALVQRFAAQVMLPVLR